MSKDIDPQTVGITGVCAVAGMVATPLLVSAAGFGAMGPVAGTLAATT